MRRRPPNRRMVELVRRRAGLLLAGAVWAGTPSVTSADESPRSQAQCEHAAEPGRVRCDVELRPAHGAVRWADVQVVGAPAFVAPLRGRIGPHEATAHEESLWRWGFGLV